MRGKEMRNRQLKDKHIGRSFKNAIVHNQQLMLGAFGSQPSRERQRLQNPLTCHFKRQKQWCDALGAS
jgi:hypothetical protein